MADTYVAASGPIPDPFQRRGLAASVKMQDPRQLLTLRGLDTVGQLYLAAEHQRAAKAAARWQDEMDAMTDDELAAAIARAVARCAASQAAD